MKKILYSILLFISSMAYSQSLNDRILEIGNYIETDVNKATTVLNEVKPEVLAASPDTIKFLYHYYSAAVEDLQGKTSDKKVEHLKEAKKIRETSLGIYDPTYLEIIWAIGNEYEERDSIETAIDYYQEGIVKGQYFLAHKNEIAMHWYGSFLSDLGRLYEIKYPERIVKNLYISSFNLIQGQYISGDSFSYFPIWRLSQYYKRRKKYDKSIQYSDIILSHIEKNEGTIFSKAYSDQLYFKGNILVDDNRISDAIKVFETAIMINDTLNNKYAKNLSGLYGNYVLALTQNKEFSTIESFIPFLKDFSIKNNDKMFYMNTLYSICKTLISMQEYNEALYYNSLIYKDFDFLTQNKEKQVIRNQKDNILFLIDNEKRIIELENQINSNESPTFEKCSLIFELGKRYNIKGEKEKAISYFNKTIDGLKSLKKSDTELYAYSLNNITGIYMDMNMYDKAFLYAVETMNHSKIIFGEESDEYITSCNDLCVIYIKLEKYDEGFKYAEIAVNKSLEKNGTNNNTYAVALHNLGRLYQLTDNMDKAKSLLEESKRIQLLLNGNVAQKTEQYLKEIEGGNAK